MPFPVLPRGALYLSLVLLGGACQSNEPPEMTREQKLGAYLENALRYYEQRDYDRALHQVRQGLSVDRRNERFLLMLGKIHLLRGTKEDLAIAEQVFERHPEPKDYRVQLGLGEANERLGLLKAESAEAIRSGEAYTEHPDPEERAVELTRQAREHWERAYQAYEDSLELFRGEVGTVNGLVRVSALLKREHESIEWSRELLDVIAESTRLRRLELEDSDIGAGRERDVLDSIRANEEVAIGTHLHVANLYFRMGLLEEAADELSRVIEIDPERAAAYSQRAQVLFELGRYALARDSIDRFLRLSTDRSFDDPDIRRAYELEARCRAALTDAEGG